MRSMTRLAAGLFALFATLLAAPVLGQTDIEPPEGAWTHRAAGVEFPTSVGPFSRTRITEFDEEGTDAGVGYVYRDGNGVLTVTVYVYPALAGTSCADEFMGTKAPIEQYPGVSLVTESSALPPDGNGPGSALYARYYIPENAMREGIPAVLSDAYLFCPPGEQWLVKYRASWNGSSSAFPDVGSLLRAIDWPAGLRDN